MPEFSSHEYWEARFQQDGTPFDWLIPAQALCEITSDWVDSASLKQAEVLHIGCGTSDSSALRQLVKEPVQVHNVDYSQAAVDAAVAREREVLEAEDQSEHVLAEAEDKQDSLQQPKPPRGMRWSCLDLLSLNSALSLMDQQAEAGKLFDLVLDKSTSDSMACGSDIPLRLPYLLSVNGWTRGILQSGVAQSADVHPLHVLAVHLAALTRPSTGKWIAVSYSEDRFPFLPPYPQSESHGFLPDSMIKAGFPHPHQLWSLESKEKIDLNARKEETLAERKKRLTTSPIRRPQVSHWLYVMARTEALVTD